ncbi:hypothetical protein E3246_22695, partial [Shigella flexneri]|nr:hypothetical protein [Shigella flexneri]
MLPSETMIWQPEFTDKTLSRKPGAVHIDLTYLSRLRVSRYRFVLQHYFYYIHSKHITSCFIFVDDVLSCL